MGRAPCCDKDGLKKGPWLPEEDQKLVDFVHEHGPGNWRSLPKKAGLQRCGKSCRLRWTNYLRPDIKRGRFTFEEEEAIIQLHSVLGNKWSAIAAKLPGRTDNEIKNYWNTHIRKRLLRTGIDPVTHTHRLDLLNLPSILNSPLQNSSHFNLLKLLSLQSLVNPDLLRLAALLSSNPNPNPTQNQNQDQNSNLNFLFQNAQRNELVNNSTLMQNQYHQMVQTNHQTQPELFLNNDPTCSTTMTTNYNDAQVIQPNIDQCNTTTFANFGALNFDAQNSSMVYELWQSNAPLVNADQYVTNNNYLSTAPEDQSNKNQSLSLNSVLSTPCTSQETPLNSNSEYPNSSSISSTTTEDEIDSYCRSLMNFDIPEEFFNIC